MSALQTEVDNLEGSDPSLLGIAREKRAWLIAIVLACVAAAAAFAFLSKPVYRAETVLLPVTQDGDMSLLASMASQFGALGSLAGIDVGGDSEKEKALATMRSRALTDSFIESHGLLSRIFEDDWDAAANKWNLDADEVPTRWEAQKVFDEDIRFIVENRRTGLVTVAIEWRDPDEAAKWANELVALVNRTIRERVIAESKKSLTYLNKELESTDAVEVRQAIFKLAEAQARKIMLANVRDDYAFQVIDPAMPPDRDDFVRPQRAVLILAGLLGGLAVALSVVLVIASLRRSRRVR
jgi:uncharacterized protein involved in exopolysaccharide biosynthesis